MQKNVYNINTVVQENAYYPFGATIADLSYNASLSTNRYKREGKEYISDFSWNKYDYTARTFDPWNGQALQLDPLAEKYYSTSPYALFLNNPMRFIDPTGMIVDDYYNQYGQYLYTDTKKTDYIKIIQQDKWAQIQENHVSVLANSSQSNLALISDLEENSTPINMANLSAEVVSNIFTDIVSKMDDLDVNMLHNGQVSVFTNKTINDRPIGYNDPYKWTNFAYHETVSNNKSKVTINTNWLSEFNTVSNIQNLMIHELKGHGYPLNYSGNNGNHYKAYELQRQHKSWKNTTPEFKEHINENYDYYLKREKR